MTLKIKTAEGRVYEPNPSQRKFHETDARYRLFSSSFGGGKTFAGCVEVVKLSVMYPGNRILVGRLTTPAWRETTWRRLFEALPRELIRDYRKSEKRIVLKNSSEIMGAAFDKPIKLGSLELGGYLLDEAVEFPQNIVRMLNGRLRWAKVPKRYGMLLSNPADEEHYLYDDYIGKPKPNHAAVLGSLEDNRDHLPEDYVEELEGWKETDPEYYQRYVLGEWCAFEGRVFKNYGRRTHVLEPDEIPDIVETWVGMDFGFTDPTAIIVIGVCKDWDTYALEEFYQTGTTTDDWLRVLEGMKRRWNFRKVYADPSGAGYIETLRREGVPIEKANNDVALRIMVTRRRLATRKDTGEPGHFISSRCPNLIKETGNYRYDPRRPEKPLKTNDHAVDAQGYALVGIDQRLRRGNSSTGRATKPNPRTYQARRRSVL